MAQVCLLKLCIIKAGAQGIKMNDLSLFSIAVVLFLIMDPVGNIASYLSLTRELQPKRRTWVLIREMAIALVLMLIFNFIGEYIFSLLEISEITVRLASGAILFLVAIKILFPSTNSFRSNLLKGEPFIVPLAIPLVAGPSLLATIMLYANMESSETVMLAAIFVAVFAAFLVFLLAPYIFRLLGNNGLLALEKLMGMILVLMAVQRFADGIKMFLTANAI